MRRRKPGGGRAVLREPPEAPAVSHDGPKSTHGVGRPGGPGGAPGLDAGDPVAFSPSAAEQVPGWSPLGILVEKWQALGNDFLLAWDRNQLPPGQIIRLCHRQLGAGADGVLFLKRQVDTILVRLYNQDGSQAEYSGNGFRCVIASAFTRRRPQGRLTLMSGRLAVHGMLDEGQPVVAFDAKSFGCEAHPAPAELVAGGPLEGLLDRSQLFVVRAGNPHLILLVADLKKFRTPAVDEILDRLREPGAAFPEGINVSVAQPSGRGRYLINTWERGVGLSKSCASAATALFYLLRATGETGANLTVENPGGSLHLRDDAGLIHLRGPVRRVFTAMVDPVESDRR